MIYLTCEKNLLSIQIIKKVIKLSFDDKTGFHKNFATPT